jgi:hypothetical protein
MRLVEHNGFEVWFQDNEEHINVSEGDARKIWKAGADASGVIYQSYMKKDQIDHAKPIIDRLNF